MNASPALVDESRLRPAPETRLLEALAALATVFLIGFRFVVGAQLQVTFLVAVVLLPVTWSVLRERRELRWILVLAVAAACSGLVLTGLAAEGLADRPLATRNTALVLAVGLCVPALYWARTVIGTRAVVLTYGVASLLSVGFEGLNPGNPWKFSLALPMTMVVLSLPWIYRRRTPESLALLVLGAACALNDARSATAMLLVVFAVVLTQRSTGRPTASRWLVVMRFVALGLAAYFAIQAAALDGMLGEAAQSRTEAQIVTSGSLIEGGRPEMGAARALVSDSPWGVGSGTLASPEVITTAKAGMASLGYDPDNGYVENYMFGYGLEVHSLTGDLWLWFGVPGALLAVVTAATVGLGSVRALAAGRASAISIFLAVRTLWDLAFSPATTSLITLLVTLAVVLPLADRHHSSRTSAG